MNIKSYLSILFVILVSLFLITAKASGATWTTKVLDSSGIVGLYSSIAIDSSGKVHISYYANDNLKYAATQGSAISPAPNVKANGSDTLINITSDDNLLVTVELNAGGFIGLYADWWVAANVSGTSTIDGWYYFDVGTMNWTYAGDSYTDLSPTYQGSLFDLSPFTVLNIFGLPAGTYIIYFAVDNNMNGSLISDKLYTDSVTVAVESTTCTYSISPMSQTFSSDGGTGNVNVTAPSGCNWTAISNTSWITITSGNSGSGNGIVNYSVLPNTSSSRTGTMTIAGQTFTVVQNGTVDLSGTWNASYTINGTPATLIAILNQTSATSLTGTWTSSLGSDGTLSGFVSDKNASFVLIQTTPCSGSFNVFGTYNDTYTKITGTFSGSDCSGSATGTFTAVKYR